MIKQEGPIPLYKTVDRCAACGMKRTRTVVNVWFVKNIKHELGGTTHDESYMEITCRNCGFAWKELPFYLKSKGEVKDDST